MKRKWILGIVIALVIIAVVLTVVFVFILREKDTKQLANELNAATTKGYLSTKADGEYEHINKYLTDISKDQGSLSGYQFALIKNYIKIYDTSIVVAEFVNNQMPFTEWTEFYSQNGKKVVDDLKNAQKKAEKIKKDVAADRELAGGNITTLQNLWKDRGADVTAMIDYTVSAMGTLGEIYTSCVTSKTFNNDLTEVIFKFYKEHLGKVNEELQGNKDGKSFSQTATDRLDQYVSAYFKKSEMKERIANYYHQYGDLYATGELKVVVENLKAQGSNSYYYDTMMGGYLFNINEEKFTMTFDAGYEDAEPIESITFTNYAKIETVTPGREGYKFVGWKVTSESKGTWVKDTVYAKGEGDITFAGGNVGNVTLTAQWEEIVEEVE